MDIESLKFVLKLFMLADGSFEEYFSQKEVDTFRETLNIWSRAFGYDDWVDAYHKLS